MKQNKAKLEHEVSHTLREGKMKNHNPEEQAQQSLLPKYEIRIPAKMDPIVEETRIIRSMAKEIDSRYDEYVKDKLMNTKQKNED